MNIHSHVTLALITMSTNKKKSTICESVTQSGTERRDRVFRLPDLYSGGSWFESWPRIQLFWLMFSTVLLSRSWIIQ